MSNEVVRAEELQAEVMPVVERAASIVVASPDQYEIAAGFLKAVKAAQKRVEDWFAEPVKAAHSAWKALTNRRDETLQPLANAERTVKNKMVAYAQDQERIRAAEQARLQAEADERARREREAAEKAAAKLKTPELREQRMAEAAAIAAPVVTVAATTPEVKGQSIRKTWKARIVDPKAAALAVMQWPDWSAYVSLNAAELNRFAARTKGSVSLPGVEWYEDATLASGSR
jgi:hypothetical protein